MLPSSKHSKWSLASSQSQHDQAKIMIHDNKQVDLQSRYVGAYGRACKASHQVIEISGELNS